MKPGFNSRCGLQLRRVDTVARRIYAADMETVRKHGTRRAYSFGCRCAKCRKHQSYRMRVYHEAHPRSKGVPIKGRILTRSEAGRIGGLALREKARREWEKNKKQCPSCGAALPFAKRVNTYCDRRCSDVRVRLRTVLNCCVCGDVITGSGKKYCSRRCNKADVWNDTKKDIKRLGKFKTSGMAKRYLLEVCGHECVLCKLTVWRNKPTPLVMDHRNGNAGDWRIKNLRMVCPNCDAQLPTYKGRNRGRGRFSRRMRYRNGQSY